MLESILGKEGFQPAAPPLPKAFPLGGRCPSAHTGADEGATGLPNGAGEERRRGDRSLLLQGKVGYRIAPSSVTFGDSFPPRGSLWVVQPYTKKRSKSGHVHGYRNSPSTGTMRHNRQNERVPTSGPSKKGGRGSSPATLCVRAFSRESLDPRPGPGGNPRRRSGPATVPEGTTCRSRQRPPAPPASPSGRRSRKPPHQRQLNLAIA